MVTEEDKLIVQGKRQDFLTNHAVFLAKGGAEAPYIKSFIKFAALHHSTPPDADNVDKEVDAVVRTAYKTLYGMRKSLQEEIKEFVMSTSGLFMSTDVHKNLHLATRQQKKNCSNILARLVKDELIERVPPRNGVWRMVNNTAPDIDVYNVDTEFLPIKYPLGIHHLFRTMPKNIVVIAGSQDAGKTAYCLRFTSMNMNRGMELRYQSSEMGAMELKNRLEDFEGLPLDHWKNVNFKEVSSDFQDYIVPDGINVIDYLEITDNFYQVAGSLTKIHNKLQGGIAIVCLQKDGKSDLGRGGSFSLEKPRLYLSLSHDPNDGNIAKIVKAKNWAQKGVNPNKRQCHFKIINGNEIRQVTDWIYPVK